MKVFNENIKLIIIFGSQARQTAAKHSDTDIAVLADRPLGLEDKIKIGETVAKNLGVSEDTIDVVDLWVAPPLLQYHVAQEGKLFYGSDFDFTRFRVLAWKRYQDTAKFRRARETALRASLEAETTNE
ncbi:MAG: hypothetical protein UU22_C0044G0007 [Parcubacteria group bacterium GW2011_GWA2_40_8]|nr:MAG: hypothetical protein UT82_C0038G0006 [Parcubacteria group bacterium GW2011_GWB1_40_14]KKR77425.1 MAG: hypothetical protein UU22_C0044G0007 [Parcubacteria group bacterium GW2011_GWA2_40_8]